MPNQPNRPSNARTGNGQPNQAKGGGKRPNRHEASMASRRNLERARERSGFDQEKPDSPDKLNRTGFGRQASRAELGRGPGEKVLRLVPLGGLGEVGKNLNVLEYGNDAIIVDAGLKLGVDLPGINYAVPEFTYLEKIKHKLRGYVFTHGHLDHVEAMPFLLAAYPLPVYGSRFTLDMLERVTLDRDPNVHIDKRYLNPDTHEQVSVGPFTVELVRVTHSIPDPTAAVITTPVGKIVHTGDFRLDPTPLDGKPTDLNRLKQLGQEGVLLLMSDSTNCDSLGRTPTEQSIIPGIDTLVKNAPGRVILSAVSTNINRIQAIIDILVRENRRIAIDGRSMLANIEMAVRNGYVRIPRGGIVAMRDVGKVPDRNLAIISTGHQGELGSVLMRMASGEHKFVKLKPTDTVIMSASPIPGNERAVVVVVDRLLREGTIVFQHKTRELDGTGPLHVSGHGNQDELAEMIEMVKPKYFAPIHGEFHHQLRHAQLAQHIGMPKDHIFVLDNGDVLEMSADAATTAGRVPAASQLVDQNGDVIPNLVIQDRLLMSQDGIVVVVLTLDRKSGATLSSPDIISRGFVYLKENERLINDLRDHLRQFSVRRFGKVEINRFKQELRDDINHYLFNQTGRSPVIIPVVNVVGPGGQPAAPVAQLPPAKPVKSLPPVTGPGQVSS